MPMRDAVTNIVELDALRQDAGDPADARALGLRNVSLAVGGKTLIEDMSLALSVDYPVPDSFCRTRHVGNGRSAPSRPREFHPEPLTDPDLILSHHPAPAIARRLPPSTEREGSSRHDRLAQVQRR